MEYSAPVEQALPPLQWLAAGRPYPYPSRAGGDEGRSSALGRTAEEGERVWLESRSERRGRGARCHLGGQDEGRRPV